MVENHPHEFTKSLNTYTYPACAAGGFLKKMGLLFLYPTFDQSCLNNTHRHHVVACPKFVRFLSRGWASLCSVQPTRADCRARDKRQDPPLPSGGIKRISVLIWITVLSAAPFGLTRAACNDQGTPNNPSNWCCAYTISGTVPFEVATHEQCIAAALQALGQTYACPQPIINTNGPRTQTTPGGRTTFFQNYFFHYNVVNIVGACPGFPNLGVVTVGAFRDEEACPILSLTPYSPDPYPLNVENLTDRAKQAVSCLATCSGQSPTAFLSSAYRPVAYQDHLREVWSKWTNELQDETRPACAALKAQVKKEFDDHGLGASTLPPARTSCHTRGGCVDVNRSFTETVDFCSQCSVYRPWPYLPPPRRSDPVHVVPY